VSPTPNAPLAVADPETAAPAPIPGGLADRLDALPIDDADAFWLACRLVEYAYRLGYADGHARGYRDRDREVTVEKDRKGSVVDTAGLRPVMPKAQ
jgi:hypothetical protein